MVALKLYGTCVADILYRLFCLYQHVIGVFLLRTDKLVRDSKKKYPKVFTACVTGVAHGTYNRVNLSM